MIPSYLHSCFWEIDTAAFEPQQYPEYTIARILEWGDKKAVKWLRENFSEAEISEVIRRERRLSRKSANFWALIYGIPVEEVAALQQLGSERAWQGML